MARLFVKFTSFILVCLAILLAGCSTKEEIKNRQGQLFQSKLDKHADSRSSQEKIEVETTKGDVEIEPTVIGYSNQEISDPLEAINRPIFAFNHVFYTWVLNPLAYGYTAIMPDPVEASVSRLFSNLREPLNLLNNLLQAEGKKSGKNLGRFLINSTVGLLGLFDPAEAWFGITPEMSTINDTLTAWGVGHGAYIVIPILGQSDFRNGFSTATESYYAPVKVITDPPDTRYIQIYDGFHEFSPRASSYETLYAESEDPYVFFRNMYMQSVLRDQQFEEKDTVKAKFKSVNKKKEKANGQ